MTNKYRIVTDEFAGYEAQVKYWWWPFAWFQIAEYGNINTNQTIEQAKNLVERHQQDILKRRFPEKQKVVWNSTPNDAVCDARDGEQG